MKRFSINVTPEQAEALEFYAKYSSTSLNEAVRQFIDEAGSILVKEMFIWTDKVRKWILLKDNNVCFFKRFNDTGEMGDWVETLSIGLTVKEVENMFIECKNCEYKQYIIAFEDGTEIPVDDIIGFRIRTMNGSTLCY